MAADDLSLQFLAAARRAPTPSGQARWLARAFLANDMCSDPSVRMRIAERMSQLRETSRSSDLAFLDDAIRGLADAEIGAMSGIRSLGLAKSRYAMLNGGSDPVLVALQAQVLIALGEPEKVHALVTGALEAGLVSAADEFLVLATVAQASLAAGHLIRAEMALLEALAEADRGAPVNALPVACELAAVQALRGDLVAAHHHLEQARGGRRARRSALHRGAFARAEAVVHWVGTEPTLMLRSLEKAVLHDLVPDQGRAAELRWELGTAYVGAGRSYEARRLMIGAVPPMPMALGASCFGAWSDWICDPDSASALDALGVAAVALAKPGERHLRGRLAWLVGTQRAQRAEWTQAAEWLLVARDAFAVLGAAGPLHLVEADLDLLGVVPIQRRPGRRVVLEPLPGSAPLTAEELQVAVAVSDGLNASDVAQHLSLPVKAVEAHLSEALEKLGVRSRRELFRLHRPPV